MIINKREDLSGSFGPVAQGSGSYGPVMTQVRSHPYVSKYFWVSLVFVVDSVEGDTFLYQYFGSPLLILFRHPSIIKHYSSNMTVYILNS
jgi:hypothetical protein